MEYIGVDVPKKESQICILGEGGQVVVERRVRTERDRFAAALGGKAKARVLIEASTESEWVTHSQITNASSKPLLAAANLRKRKWGKSIA